MYKFAAKHYGPFKVKDKVGKVSYQLELPSTTSIHDIFHVFCLKKAHGSNWQFNPLPIMLDSMKAVKLVVILDRRMVKRGNQAAVQLLIDWKNNFLTKATWEFSSKLR